ncbi:hypothetical protein PLICRDRAFT_169466 [Plicaturopsis crispa FD-325 SS-3]|nr:hypothetical protein PLICRDRAFT_169466 [Plicaturopsis crispa FD-325 SS-3]
MSESTENTLQISYYRRTIGPEEIYNVRKAITVHEQQISNIEDKIQVLLNSVGSLREEQKGHQEHIRRYKGLITLATRLPPELLGVIFSICVESKWTRAPFALSQVCSAWRAAARMPSLWAHPYINCDSSDPVRKAFNWLRNAQDTQLSITLVAPAPERSARLAGVVSILLTRVARWRSLVIEAQHASVAEYIVSRCPRAAPRLRALSISVEHDEGDAGLAGFRDAFAEAPELASMKLSLTRLPTGGTRLPASIRRLDVSLTTYTAPPSFSASSFISLIDGLPLLTDLSITLASSDLREFIPEPDLARIASAPHLESLTLSVSPDINAVLSHIHAPSLRRLRLRSTEDPLGHTHEPTGLALLSLLGHSAPPLELLELRDIDLSDEHFVRMFTKLRTLRELCLHETEMSDDVVLMMKGPNALCPALRRLDLRWCGRLTGSALVQVVESRNNVPGAGEGQPTAPISEVTVINCTFVKERDIMALARATTCRIIMGDFENDYCRECLP